MTTHKVTPAPVAITGIGSISALGCDPRAIAQCYSSGATRLRSTAIGSFRVAAGALDRETQERFAQWCREHLRSSELDRSTMLGLFAAHHAAGAAEWITPESIGVVMGSSRGATGLFERYYDEFCSNNRQRTPPLTSPTTTLGNLASWIAQHVGASGPATEISSTCSTSIYAIGTAVAWLRAGMGVRFLAGGAEAPLTPFTVAQMQALRIYAKAADTTNPCRPCAARAGRRNTMVLGEGAGVLALEPMPPTGEAPARCCGVLRGVGFAVEQTPSETGLSEEGLALRLSMQRALTDARMQRVDAVVTHTPGTALGDRAEMAAIRFLFGEELPILTSNKWLLGHTLGASGVLGIEYGLYILHHQHWAEYPFEVEFVNKPQDIASVMVNSVGFGGNAGSVILTLP